LHSFRIHSFIKQNFTYMSTVRNCIIIGSGPAGYTAAIYAARAGMKPLLFTGQEPGGQLMITTDVENYPGYPDGIGGPQMMDEFRKQAERFDTEIKYELISKVDFTGPVHKIWTESDELFEAHSIVISTGASAKWLGLDSEQRLMNEEATYLAKLCPEVHMLVRRDEMRASKIMQQRVIDSEAIKIHWNTETVDILGDEEVSGVKVINNKTKEESQLDVEGFFVAIGHKPNTDIFKPWLKMDETGYLKVTPGTSYTNVEGVFASGDAADKVYRQAVTAAGTGCMAALDAERYLTEKGVI